MVRTPEYNKTNGIYRYNALPKSTTDIKTEISNNDDITF